MLEFDASCSSIQDFNKKKVHFTDEEKRFLSQLIQSKRDVIESKKVDAQSLASKRTEWEAIAAQYNSVTTHYKRTVKQLQKAWENLKFRRKVESEKKENWKRSKESTTQAMFLGIHDNAKDVTFMDRILVPNVTLNELTLREEPSHDEGADDVSRKKFKAEDVSDASSQTDLACDCSTIQGYKLEEAKCRLVIAQEELAQMREKFKNEREFLKERRDIELRILKREGYCD